MTSPIVFPEPIHIASSQLIVTRLLRMLQRCRWRVGRRPSCPVVAHRCSRVCMGCNFLNVTQRDFSVEGCGDEAVTQRVGADRLVDSGMSCWTTYNAGCLMLIHPVSRVGEEDRSFDSFVNRFRDSQSVESQQACQRVIPRTGQAGLD